MARNPSVEPAPVTDNFAQRQRRLHRVGLLLGIVVVLALVPLSLHLGPERIALSTAWDAITAFDPGSNDHLRIQHERIPRTLIAILTGCALGVAGTLMQALTRNPLADPGILGINAGAAVGIVIAIAWLAISHVAGYIGFGVIGAAVAGVAVSLLGGARQGIDPVRLVLAGAALTFVLLALTQIIIINADESVFDQFRHWAAGSLRGRRAEVLLPVTLLVVPGLLIALTIARALDAMALGSDLGRSLGARPALVWALSAVAIVLLAGAATAAAGPISFIGLTAPHLARFIVGPDHRRVIPWAMGLSAILMLAADCLGRVIAHPDEIGVGIMVALIGGPFFVALARRRRLVQL